MDLCGPMPCASRSGRLYSMNLIDDFSSYVWSLPLRSKDESSSVLQMWHHTMVNQNDHRLKTLVSDNGELVSKSMHEWTSMHGIEHVTTAPYTSAQNGHAEHLHRTLLGRARAMRLSCNAPAYLWDEFCATAAYLTNLTALSTLQGRTPYKVWTGHIPSLSHLREIGCRAFVLIQTHNPKIYQCSCPCILIGYPPHAKAYRLWDVTSGAVFNSFHVTFLKHLNHQPFDLLPRTIITLNPNVPPSWDMPPPSEPPSNTVSTLTPPSTLDSSLTDIPASTSSSPTLPPSPILKPSSSNDTTSSLCQSS
jgi:transposase InsO family protein